MDRDVDDHESCPGHAATVSAWYGQVNVQYHCRDWKSHGHIDAWTSGSTTRGQLTEVEKAERRRVRANNEAWRAAQDVRRRWLRTQLLAAKKPPKRAQQYLLTALAYGGSHLTRALTSGNRYACRLVGLPEPKPGQHHPLMARARRATAEQALTMSLAILIGACEEAMHTAGGVDTWRHPPEESRLYFTALQDWGYVLSQVERLVLDPDADKSDWPHLNDQPAVA